MQSETLLKLVSDIKKQKAESQTIELKAAGKGCPTRLFDTLSAFPIKMKGELLYSVSMKLIIMR